MTSSIIFHHSVFRKNFMNLYFVKYGYFKQMCSIQLSPTTNLMFKNPCLELQQYVQIPIFKKEQKCFDPSPESMKLCQELFVPHENNDIKCISKTIDPKKFPSHNLPEVAVLGRSNAGKSSLLKAIFKEVPELRIQASQKPGHTKCLKFYQVGKHLCLVDMPGYGFRQPKWFETSVMYYLKNRRNLVKTFLLIDCKESFHAWDDAALQMVKDMKIPFTILLTKIDTVSDSQRLKTLLYLQNMINNDNMCFPQIFMISSHTFEGLAYFLAYIAHITGNLNRYGRNSFRRNQSIVEEIEQSPLAFHKIGTFLTLEEVFCDLRKNKFILNHFLYLENFIDNHRKKNLYSLVGDLRKNKFILNHFLYLKNFILDNHGKKNIYTLVDSVVQFNDVSSA